MSQGFIQCIALRIAIDLVSYYNTSNVVIVYVHIQIMLTILFKTLAYKNYSYTFYLI